MWRQSRGMQHGTAESRVQAHHQSGMWNVQAQFVFVRVVSANWTPFRGDLWQDSWRLVKIEPEVQALQCSSCDLWLCLVKLAGLSPGPLGSH